MFGNKRKRRDKERDPSTSYRLFKAGKTALAIGAGAVFLHNTETGSKFFREISPALIESGKNFTKDFSKIDKRSLLEISNTVDKHFSYDNLEKLVRENNNKKLVADFTNSSLYRQLLSKEQFMSSTHGIVNELKNDYKDNVIKYAVEKVYADNIVGKKKDLSKDHVYQIVSSVFNEISEPSIENDLISSKIEKTLNKANINKEEQKEIFETINEIKDKYYSENAKKKIDAYTKDNIDTLKKQVDDIFYSNTLINVNRSKCAKANKLFKSVFRKDINLEEKLTGSNAITVQEFIDNFDTIFSSKNFEFLQHKQDKSDKKTKTFDFLEQLKTLVEKNEDAKNLIVSKNFRKYTDEDGVTHYFSSQTNNDFIDKIMGKVKETLPYRIMFKGIDEKNELPNIFVSHKGFKSTLTPHIKLNGEETESMLDDIEHNVNPSLSFFINGRLYFTKEKDGLINIDEHNYVEAKLLKGYKKKEYYSLIDDRKFIYPESYDSNIAKALDINQNGKLNIFNTVKRALHKFDDPNWEFNSIQNVEEVYTSGLSPIDSAVINVNRKLSNEDLKDPDKVNKALVEELQQLHKNEIVTAQHLNQNIKGVTNDILESLLENDDVSDKHKKLIQSLLDEDLDSFLKTSLYDEDDPTLYKEFENDRLNALINKWLSNTNEMMNATTSIQKKGFRIPLLDMPFDENYKIDKFGQLRIETVKDILLDVSEDLDGNELFEWIDNLDVSKKDKYSLKDISVTSLFERATKTDISPYSEDMFLNYTHYNNLAPFFSENSNVLSHFEANMGEIKSKYGPLSKGSSNNLNEVFYPTEENYAVIKKSNIGKILISDINEGIKLNSQAVIDTAKEIFAGRDNPENVTDLTLGLRYLYTRLNNQVSEFGIGLSNESIGSLQDTVKNIALKRVLPLMAVSAGLDVLNYESEKITGVSLKGAAANALANIDLGTRQILDSTRLSSALNWFAETSVIGEYYTGDRKFKTKEEEQQWYEEGYSPVRKGRFWSFGSSSEFRGGSVTYYQPNYLKRAHSNYHDISVYGSEDEKWAHSFIPTPQHPLAPLRRLIDPYWLERKHLKENDRPYPLTGKMFDENSFLGSFLNPTVGQILKPVKMLPEAKRRLGKNGIDAKSSIERLNTRIKQRGNKKDDLLVVEGSDIRNAEYVPYGNPEKDEVNISIYNGKPEVKGVEYANNLEDIDEYKDNLEMNYHRVKNKAKNLSVSKEKRLVSNTEKFLKQLNGESYSNSIGKILIENINSVIKSKSYRSKSSNINNNYNDSNNKNLLNEFSKVNSSSNKLAGSNAPDSKEGIYIYHNLVNERLNFDEDYYQRYDTEKMVNKSVFSDYKKDFIFSQKQINGIYGFLAEKFFGSKTFTYRYENAGNLTSFSKKFWDANIGGLGGGIMEIARRFFPPEDRSRVNINPLRNNMPDWIPDTYHFGDPYTVIPKGEMRLPGKGYESLNKLHPDFLGKYGAFDRYKILADIAPNSAEFKKYKSIAQNTITDPVLKKQMEDISVRVAKMSGNHEFYNYNYIHTNTTYKKGIVKGVSNGQIILSDNERLSLAGIISTEKTDETLKNILTPGQKINYKTYKDINITEDKQPNIQAVIYNLNDNGRNVNQQLIESGSAQENKEDFSPLAVTGKQSGMQEVLGAIQEVVAHAKIPIIHNKFLKIETPFESYKSETYYGSNFKTWDNPIRGFVTPAFNEQSGKSLLNESLSLGYAIFHFTKVAGKTDNKLLQYASNVALTTLNPTAFVGGSIGFGSKLAVGNLKGSGENNLSNFQKGAIVGTIVGTVKYGIDNADSPIRAATSFALAGASASQYFKDIEPFIKKVFKKDIEKFGTKQGATIGAAIGLGISALKNPYFDKDKMFRKWAPKDTRKKWELDEYFDRLTYIKYSGLYRVASARAALFEKTNIRSIFEQMDKNKKKLAKINKKINKLIEKDIGKNKHQMEIDDLMQKKMRLQEQEKTFFTGGKYTKSAVAYKKKMESTIYGLSPTATKDELLASVPNQYKDHFKAFMDITDKTEQKKILKYVPKYLQRPLQIAWGQTPNKVKSNRVYFKNHKLPSMAWKGWKPNVNLKHVKMKTIENEGMLFSDFGYYESEKSKPNYSFAPDIKDFDKSSGESYRLNLIATLHGLGINHCNVSVEPTSAPGMWIVGDIKDTEQDLKNASQYKINSFVQTVAQNFI